MVRISSARSTASAASRSIGFVVTRLTYHTYGKERQGVNNGLFRRGSRTGLLLLMFVAPVQQWPSVTWIAVLPCATRRRVAFWRMCSASISVPAWFAMRVASAPGAAGHEDQKKSTPPPTPSRSIERPRQLAEEIAGSRECWKGRGLPRQVYPLCRNVRHGGVRPTDVSEPRTCVDDRCGGFLSAGLITGWTLDA